MSELICPHCRISNGIDCRENECPQCFVPKTWQRPLLEITQDLERYEALIVSFRDWWVSESTLEQCGEMAKLLSDEALKILAKQKKGGAGK